MEATKYTEVGYHGRDVESMIRDLVELAVHMVRNEQAEVVRSEAERLAEEQLIDTLLPSTSFDQGDTDARSDTAERRHRSREKIRVQLRAGELDDRVVEISTEAKSTPIGLMATIGTDQFDQDLQGLMERLAPATPKPRSVGVPEARKILFEQQCDKLIDRDKVTEIALRRTENSGIVFLDELDKLATPSQTHGPDISRAGVQRDLLPIVEGCSVNTRYGTVKTDHILFIAAGAFYASKPSDLMPELQGRLPVRVELDDLGRDEFLRILTEPENALTKQHIALLGTESVHVEFESEALEALADIAFQLNQSTENIGARRLHTVLERLLEQVSFEAADLAAGSEGVFMIDAAYVDKQLKDLAQNEDLSRYIL